MINLYLAASVKDNFEKILPMYFNSYHKKCLMYSDATFIAKGPRIPYEILGLGKDFKVILYGNTRRF